MSRPTPATNCDDAYVGYRHAQALGPQRIQLPGGDIAFVNDANQLTSGTLEVENGFSLMTVMLFTKVASGMKLGLCYQMSVEEARALSANIAALADEAEAKASTQAAEVIERARKGGRS